MSVRKGTYDEWAVSRKICDLEDALQSSQSEADKLREALQDCAEHLELALARLGCPVHGNDGGGDGKHDADSFGGCGALERARAALGARK